MALCTLLRGPSAAYIGGFITASAWMPFAKNINRVLENSTQEGQRAATVDDEENEWDFLAKALLEHTAPGFAGRRKPPVFLGHGSDDAFVDFSLGREARDVLVAAGFDVTGKEYVGAEQDGHSTQAPDEIYDIYDFIAMD